LKDSKIGCFGCGFYSMRGWTQGCLTDPIGRLGRALRVVGRRLNHT